MGNDPSVITVSAVRWDIRCPRFAPVFWALTWEEEDRKQGAPGSRPSFWALTWEEEDRKQGAQVRIQRKIV